MENGYEIWNSKSFYMAGSLKTVARELAKYVTSTGIIRGQIG
jgi:hypothetical protein